MTAPSSTRAWVLEIGGSHATATVVDADRPDETGPRLIADIDGAADRDVLLDAIARPAKELLRSSGGDAATAEWAIAIPGPFEYDTGIGKFRGVGKFESLWNVDVRQELSVRLGAAAENIHFVNDAIAYGLGEWGFGAPYRSERFVCITLGTGIGSAFLRDGIPVRTGGDVPPDGEAHYLRIGDRPLEATVSTRAITADFAARTGRVSDVKQIAALAADDDRDARAVLNSTMRALGSALAPWMHSFRATDLVIGGSMTKSWSVLAAPLREGLRDANSSFPTVNARPSTLLDTAPLLGAALWLHRNHPSPPTDLE